ncbi:MAG: phosphoribosylformylglycinamidine synthase [Spirochaetes bacterium]|nr:phosphoribosylformylglycinamidine synthase [Spirochaetota bacterium]
MEYRRIEIAVKPALDDPFAVHTEWEIRSTLGLPLERVRRVCVYTVYSDLSKLHIRQFAAEVLNDPVLTVFSALDPVALTLGTFAWAVEVSFRQGVTDNVGHTAAEMLRTMFRLPEGSVNVYSSTQYLIDGDLTREDVETVASEVLCNTLIQEIDLLDYGEFKRRGGFFPKRRHFLSSHMPRVARVDLHIADEELVSLSEKRVLALSLDELLYFRSYFDRDDVKKEREAFGIGADPTDVEIEVFAQTQSEHCKHKIFNAEITYRENKNTERISSLFRTYIVSATERISKKKDWLVSVFRDNAGVVRFTDRYNLAFKVETHNSPSALDPYGGAITGIVGCDRDPAGTGIGSRIIAHTDALCFGDPYHEGPLPPRMMHPKRIMEGVIKGIEDGGNKCGIPTVNGAIVFDPSFSGKPLVFCGSVGIMPETVCGMPSHDKRVSPGDIIVMVGGRIGKDGIHGATFSSEEIKESSPVQAVQIGDPITQKKMLDMLLEAQDRCLYRAITDNGAGGLSSSVGEMALLSGGASLEIDKAPLKYEGLDPWEILLSEAQERMTLAVPPDRLSKFLSLAESRDVLATPIGEFTDSGFFCATSNGEPVCRLDLDFLHSKIPMALEAEWEPPRIEMKKPSFPDGLGQALLALISDLNGCSREPVVRRFDHEVGGGSVVKPYVGKEEAGPADGGVISPLETDKEGFVLSCGINPFYSRLDTYHMAACVLDEALRNAVVCGADPDRIALLDNFCWPDPVYDKKKTPDGKYKLAQLVRACRGLYDTAMAYETPFISGKDSMKNDYKVKDHKVSVLPTILVSAVGIVPDVLWCVTPDFKIGGDVIYLLGCTGRHLGESLFYRKFGGGSRDVPVVDTERNMRVYRTYHGLLKRGLVASGHDLSEGGMATAAAESCIAGGMGAEIRLDGLEPGGSGPGGVTQDCGALDDDEALFSESTGRILVSVDPSREDEFGAFCRGIPYARIGTVKEDKRLTVFGRSGKRLFSLDVEELEDRYRAPLYGVLGMKRA